SIVNEVLKSTLIVSAFVLPQESVTSSQYSPDVFTIRESLEELSCHWYCTYLPCGLNNNESPEQSVVSLPRLKSTSAGATVTMIESAISLQGAGFSARILYTPGVLKSSRAFPPSWKAVLIFTAS